MRRYQNWLAALGLMALTPGVTLAGPINPKAQVSPVQSAAGGPAVSKNQRTAEEIAAALRSANLSGYDLNVSFEKGTATLKGVVANEKQRLAAERAARGVKAVTRVNNQIEVVPTAASRAAGVQHADAQFAARDARQPVRRTALADGDGEVEMPNVPPGAGGPPPGYVQGPPPGYGQGPPPTAAYGYPGATGTQMVYNQPNVPNYAWPSYAAYPNSAQVSYPKQYSASAWPYIGPFYPYPQVPLGWRKVQLEWEDGYWQLNFRPRTDRWWWFLDYRNW